MVYGLSNKLGVFNVSVWRGISWCHSIKITIQRDLTFWVHHRTMRKVSQSMLTLVRVFTWLISFVRDHRLWCIRYKSEISSTASGTDSVNGYIRVAHMSWVWMCPCSQVKRHIHVHQLTMPFWFFSKFGGATGNSDFFFGTVLMWKQKIGFCSLQRTKLVVELQKSEKLIAS